MNITRDRVLQSNFSGKIFNIDGIKRECYYCTYENGGCWIWLRPLNTDNCSRINFVISSKKRIKKLFEQVSNNEEISEKYYGHLSMQQ